jgi:hypothetical protein
MKNAIYEAVETAKSPLRMRSSTLSSPSVGPQRDLTSFNHPTSYLAEPLDQSFNRPLAPQLSLHGFRKLQQSVDILSSPKDDSKRIRRKQSSSNLVDRPRDFDDWPLPNTSLSPLLLPPSRQNFSPLLPLPPLTPLFIPSPTSPSLSSTVDTLPSTPPHTPTQHPAPFYGQWREFERTEPVRPKRKFARLRVAKRLPHHPGHHAGEGIWEVHAAVFDLAAGGGDVLEAAPESLNQQQLDVQQSSPPSNRKPGRSVRFEGIDDSSSRPLRASARTEKLSSSNEGDHSHTSTYSLSKFKFPAPPGHHWDGTFGK